MAVSIVLPNRKPPAPKVAEMALLSAIINDPDLYYQVGPLSAGHFADSLRGRIYEAAVTNISSGRPADAAALKQDFELSGTLDEIGGPQFLDELAQHPPAESAQAAAAEIRDFWLRRQLILIFEMQLREAEEGVLAAHGISSRASGEFLARTAARRSAKVFGILRVLLGQAPALFADEIEEVARLVSLVPLEIGELAASHEARAASEDNQVFAVARRARAEQLRALLGEAPA